jgi:hypothetical protein
VSTLCQSSGVGKFIFRLTGSIPVVAALVLCGCGSENDPTFVGVEEQQAKQDEERKNKLDTDTAPQQ